MWQGSAPVLAKKASEDQKANVAALRVRSGQKKQAKAKSLMWQGFAPVLANKASDDQKPNVQGSAPFLVKKASEDQKPQVAALRACSCEKSKRRPKA
ncbi:uncharacterized protein G2W53_033173 [Senna tora]|uniref:Uncharacterized protein n=1 Tax=Senna tora TaxID=362788 RepID=A0A834W7Q1_9FABA|nr:uncharacterized protein G2W53_033173 [Senna tora]